MALWLSAMTLAWADSANPNPVKMKQPDGSTITLRLHGDEFYSWVTSEDGKTLYKKDANGWWRPAGKPQINRSAVAKANNLRRQRDERIRKNSQGLGFGSNHFLIILVEWSDYKFQDGASSYWPRALGGSNFTDNGSVGSAKEYYTEASYGQFTPNFDVYGPITISRGHLDFPAGDSQEYHYSLAQESMKEALAILDGSIDFSQYDNNHDGYVDNVYMIYPGYAASNGAQNAIWPHASSIYYQTNDNVYVSSYACSAELLGSGPSSGTTLNGIGTFCHEFGHVIGLPDLYDIDYEENGSARNPSSWNLMAGGNHNSNGRIPARMCSLERMLLGYMTESDIVDLGSLGTKTIRDLSEKKYYKLPSSVDGEYFLMEVRNGSGFDSPLPAGMLIYHIDQSQNDAGGYTAKQRWDNWTVNQYGDHPCDYIMTPDPSAYGGNADIYYQLWTFPRDHWSTYYNVTEYEPEAWDGAKPYKLANILYNKLSGSASFSVRQGERSVAGTVTNLSTKQPIHGATVIVATQGQLSSVNNPISLSVARKYAIGETKTDENGKYKFVLSANHPENLTVYVFATDYLSASENVNGKAVHKDFALTPIIDQGQVNLSKTVFPFYTGGVWGSDQTGTNYTVAQKFKASEITNLVGGKIKSISFSSRATGEEVYVFVDFGTSRRVLARKVNNPSSAYYSSAFSNTVDISDADITIPANTDVYIGYLVKNANNTYIVYSDGTPAEEGSFLMYYAFSTTEAGGSKWCDVNKDLGWNTNNTMIGAVVEPKTTINPNATLGELGVSYIQVPSGTLTAGSNFPLKLVSSKSAKPINITWYFDGAQTGADSVTLTSGKHIIKAKFQVKDVYGVETDHVLEVRIEVQ